MRKRNRFASAICFAIAAAALAAPAQATSFTVMFNGPGGLGMDYDTFVTARDDFGFEVIVLDEATGALGTLDVISQDLDQTSWESFPPTGSGPHTPSSDWVVQNVSGEDLLEQNGLIFATIFDFQVGSETIDYDPANVGLVIDSDAGWVIVQLTDDEGENFYYPTLVLGALAADQTTGAFLVNYVVEEEIEQVGVNYILPQFALGYAVIPEPGTFALLGLGLTGLALQGRRRA